MTYEEAVEFMNKYKNGNIIGKIVSTHPTPFKIKYFVIAPKDYEPKQDILKELYSGIGPETALRNLNLFYRNLDVYIMGYPTSVDIDRKNVQVKNLQEYLWETNQE